MKWSMLPRGRDLTVPEACALMMLVIVAALLPGFAVILAFRGCIADWPEAFHWFTCLSIAVKNVTVFIAGLFALICYSDVAFPAVMRAFAFILVRTAVPDFSPTPGGSPRVEEIPSFTSTT